MWNIRCAPVILAACNWEAPPADPGNAAAMGGPSYEYLTSAQSDAYEGQQVLITVGGETIPPGATVELYRARSSGAGSCVHPEISPQPCLAITDHEQYLGTATVYEAEPGLYRAEFLLDIPVSLQTEMWVQGIVIDGPSPGTSEPLYVPLLPGACDANSMPFGGGSGTELDPYLLCTADHWRSMEGGGGWYRLASDIDGYGEDLHIDELYTADLDGSGYTVYVGSARSAVFGYVNYDATIHDITFDEVDVVSNRNAAAVVTYLDGVLDDMVVYGSVTGPSSARWTPNWQDYATGGVVAIAGSGATISSVYVSMAVEGGHRVGGIVGHLNGSLVNSTADVEVEGEASVGGLVGLAESAYIEYCTARGYVYGSQCFVGGAIGRSRSSGETESWASLIFSFAEVEGTRTDVGGIAGGVEGGQWSHLDVTDTEIESEGTRTGGAFGTIVEGDVYDVSLENVSVYGEGRYTGGFAGVDAAESVALVISTGAYVYGGKFGVGGIDGYHINGDLSYITIDGTIEGGGSGVGGIVGVNGAIPQVTRRPIVGFWHPFLPDPIIPDVYAANTYTNVYAGGNGAGGAVGINLLGNISAIYTYGYVQAGSDVGGLVGSLHVGSVSDSASETYVVAEAGAAGGAIGTMGTNDTVTRTYATGDVHTAADTVGGFVGRQHGGLISESIASGEVSIDVGTAGGFVGQVQGDGMIHDSFTVSDVYASMGGCMTLGMATGGFVGATGNYALHITDSYALNSSVYQDVEVSGNAFLGGLPCGYDGDPNATVQDGYIDAEQRSDPWLGVEPIGTYHELLVDYPSLSTDVWSETTSSMFEASYLGTSSPVPTWACSLSGVFCGAPGVF